VTVAPRASTDNREARVATAGASRCAAAGPIIDETALGRRRVAVCAGATLAREQHMTVVSEVGSTWCAATLTSGAAVVLTPPEFTRLLSPYLDEGYKRDSVRLRHIRVAWPRARATLDVTAYAMPSNGRYHFTAMHAMLSVCQVGIVLATIAHGFASKPGEIYMRDFSIVCRREINRTRGIDLSCEIMRAQAARDAVLYKIAYDYCAGAFTGTLRCLFPRRSSAATS
jgi:hypothetical protein